VGAFDGLTVESWAIFVFFEVVVRTYRFEIVHVWRLTSRELDVYLGSPAQFSFGILCEVSARPDTYSLFKVEESLQRFRPFFFRSPLSFDVFAAAVLHDEMPAPRQTFQEAMELVSLPSTGQTRRYAGVRAAWLPGSDIPQAKELVGPGRVLPARPVAAFGGHVFAQAGLAVSRAVEDLEDARGVSSKGRLGIHVRGSPGRRLFGRAEGAAISSVAERRNPRATGGLT